MTTSITGKLNKEASVFQAGQDSTGFGLRIGVQYYDRETKQKEWTNYECAIFAKNGPQADFYKSALVAGSIVEVSGQQQKIKSFEGQSGTMLSIELIDAKVGYIGTADAGQSSNASNTTQNSGNQQHSAQNNTQQSRPAQRQAPQPQQNVQTGLPAGDDWDEPF
jgi:single-stranded DNA-binding protein